jgi:hypothetical protein
MRCWPNANLAAALGLATFAAVVAADFKTTEVRPRLTGATLEIAGQLDLALTPKVDEALNKGIPLEILVEVRLFRENNWWWDRKLGDWKLKREIRYHALSGQYLVKLSPLRGEAQESYTSLSDALRALGNLAELRFTLDETPDDEAIHRVLVRASLDIEALPTPLRPVAYTSFAWHLNSGWSQWNVAR